MTIHDGPRSYALAIACLREKCIRFGQVAPSPNDAEERRWAAAGPVPDRDLDTVRVRE